MQVDSISSDLIRGHIDRILLRFFQDGDSYGYEIIKSITRRSGGKYELKEPSLYTSLKRLEKESFIQSYWGEEAQGARRKYYHITGTGRVALKQSIAQWLAAQRIINAIFL